MDNVINSIQRAQKLIVTPRNIEEYISIKIKPIDDGFCCCFHCWPQTWMEINNQISPYGPLVDEGDVFIGRENDGFVLECHESGPEIIIYLGATAAIASLVKSVIDIVLAIIKNRQKERIGAKFIISKRIIKNKKVIEENIMEVVFPLSKENITILNKKIKEILTKRKRRI
jgi:hypothetical protein